MFHTPPLYIISVGLRLGGPLMVLSCGSVSLKPFGGVTESPSALHPAARPHCLKDPCLPRVGFAQGFTSLMDAELCQDIVLHHHGDFIVQEPRKPPMNGRHVYCWGLLSFLWSGCPNLDLLQAYAGLSLPLHITQRPRAKVRGHQQLLRVKVCTVCLGM